MRLVGGDVGPNGPRGRVEVSVRDTDFPGVRSITNLWVPICEGISDETAQVRRLRHAHVVLTPMIFEKMSPDEYML